jgi:beta-lactamase regulating signal transducer with metallopeptidase domain
MNLLWQSAFSNTALAALLAALAALTCRFVRRPALAHGLWLLVLVKLLTPPVLPLPTGTIGWLGSLWNWWTPLPWVLAVVWFAGSVTLAVLTLARIVQFQRILALARPAPLRLQRKVELMADRLGLAEIPTVWLIPGPLPPLVWSVGPTPRVYLPMDLLCRLPAAQRGTLLAHELAHLVRGDHLIRWIEAATNIVFWWNPVAWLAARELREAEERCCDAWVVQAYPGSSRNYADALLETIDFLAEPQPALAATASGVSRIHDLETRLVLVMEGTDGKTLSRGDWWALAATAALVVPLGLNVAVSFPASPGSQNAESASAPLAVAAVSAPVAGDPAPTKR